jgi:K+-sensing histidine kinase KdpD
MTLAAIEAGIGVAADQMDLGKLVAEWVPSLSDELASSKNLSLRTFLEDDVPPVNADRELVRRLVTQLIEIAARSASPKGEIRVSVRNHKGQAWLEVMETGDADLTVMAPQAGHYSPGLAEGEEEEDGLDSMMVKTIVKRLGGQVWVRKEGPSTRNIAVSLPSIPGHSPTHASVEDGAELSWFNPDDSN